MKRITDTERRKELTVHQTARMAGCTPRAVRQAVLTWRLRARKVGRRALIWEKDAEAFAASLRHGEKKKSLT